MSDGPRETQAAGSGPKLRLERLWVLMVTAFVDMIGFALILPLLPYYATRFGADASVVGLLMAAFAFAQLVSAPLWGRLSDHWGRRPIILGGQALSALAFLAFSQADTVWLLFVCRLLQGAGGGTLSATVAYVSDAVGPDERAKALGWITACTSLGVMVGPAIASLAVGYSYAAPGLIAAGFCVANLFFAWRWLPESSPRREGPRRQQRSILRDVAARLAHPLERVSSLIWIYAAAMMAFMAMNGVLALYLADRFGITETKIGWFYFVVGGVSVLMRAVLLGVLVRIYGEVRVLRIGALALAIGMIAAPFASTVYTFMVAALFIPAGTALLFPSTTSLITRFAEDGETGQLMGVQQAFGGISRLLGPAWAGLVYETIGPREPFWIGGLLVLLTGLFALRLHPGEAPKRRGGKEDPARVLP